MRIFKILIIFLSLSSCKPIQLVPLDIKKVQPVLVCIDDLKMPDIGVKYYKLIADTKDNQLKKALKENHLLRVEIDALKRKLIKAEVEFRIEKVEEQLNKITLE